LFFWFWKEEKQLKINDIFIVDGDGNVNVDFLPWRWQNLAGEKLQW
jgi:hypothetical protein